MLKKFSYLAGVVSVAAGVAFSTTAAGADFPSRPVTIVVPYPPGR